MLMGLLGLAFCVCVFSLIYSFIVIRKQRKALDKGMDFTSVRHPILANPMIIVYIAFPIAALLGGFLWMYYVK